MPAFPRFFIVFGALSAALTVILGAAAAHVPVVVQAAANPVFQKALSLHQFHALGLIAVGLIAQRLPASRGVRAAGVLMVLGSLLFSGNLYLSTLLGIDTFRALVPWGGGAWILAWLTLASAVVLAGRSAILTAPNGPGNQ